VPRRRRWLRRTAERLQAQIPKQKSKLSTLLRRVGTRFV
jgi:hypothetical protein